MKTLREDFASAISKIKPSTGVEVQAPEPETEKPSAVGAVVSWGEVPERSLILRPDGTTPAVVREGRTPSMWDWTLFRKVEKSKVKYLAYTARKGSVMNLYPWESDIGIRLDPPLFRDLRVDRVLIFLGVILRGPVSGIKRVYKCVSGPGVTYDEAQYEVLK